MNTSTAIVSNLFVGIIWFITLIFLISATVLLIDYYKGKKHTNAQEAQFAIPVAIMSLSILCFPLYLESVTQRHLVFSKEGAYLYTVKPNLFGYTTQYNWNSHYKNGQRVWKVSELIAPLSPKLAFAEIASCVNDNRSVKIYYKEVKGSDEQKIDWYTKRAKALMYLQKYEVNNINSIVKNSILNSTKEISIFLDKKSSEESNELSTKIDLLTQVMPVNEELKSLGFRIVDIEIY